MTQQLPLLEQRLQEIFAQWKGLEPAKLRRKKINLILPFIQIASYLSALHENPSIAKLLEDFRAEYQAIFAQEIAKMRASDISPKLMARLAEVQSGGEKLNIDEVAELLTYENKYVHAHSRVLFNYGNFLKKVLPKLEPAKQEEIRQKFSEISQNENIAEVVAGLIKINKLFDLEKNSNDIEKDDLENHALLNQMSNYLQNIAQLPEILLDNVAFQKAKASFATPAKNSEIKRPEARTEKSDLKAQEKTLQEFEEKLKAKGLSMQVGIESEFTLHPLKKRKEPTSPHQKNAALKRILADLNARGYMQEKYKLPRTLPKINDMNLFFEHGDESADSSISTDNLQIISEDIKRRSPETLEAEIKKMVANFTEAETFFYKLLFLTDIATKRKIEIDGIFDPHPANAEEEKNPEKIKERNFANIFALIKTGTFHEKLLDMIQVHEISVGPHEFSKIIKRTKKSLVELKKEANGSGASLNNPNVQLNLSLWIGEGQDKVNVLKPVISGEGQDTKVTFNKLGAEFLRILQEVVAESAQVQGVLRNQESVGTVLDRNKVIGKKLEGTPYREVNSEVAAFLNHKQIAAKNSTLRLSVLNEEKGVAVVEVRLVGNNPHFATFDRAENVFQSSLTFIPEHILSKVAERFEQFVANKSAAQIRELYDEKIEIDKDGKIAGLLPTTVKSEVKRDNLLDPDARQLHVPSVVVAPRSESTRVQSLSTIVR